MEFDVDGGERIVGPRVVGIAGQAEQVRQVEPDLKPLAGDADGIRHRLVAAGDAEPPGIRAGGSPDSSITSPTFRCRAASSWREKRTPEVGLRVRGRRGPPCVGERDGEAEE